MDTQSWHPQPSVPSCPDDPLRAQAVARRLLEFAAEAGIPRQSPAPSVEQFAGGASQCANPVELNPLEPAAGPDGARFPLQSHARLVRALFLAAFDADEPFPQVLTGALLRCYEQAGWSLVTGEQDGPDQDPPAYPTLGHLRAAALAVVDETGFDRATAAKARDMVNERISPRLCTADGLAADDDQFRAFISGTALIRHLESPPNSGKPRFDATLGG
jgi:hypothetical protein